MKKYKVKMDPEALADIQNITNWYNQAQDKLGKRFQDTAISKIKRLSNDPQIFAIRYS
jgi:plasmid stabilization system protein ParE